MISVQQLVQEWAPLVFLAPGEKFYPSDVTEFLNNMIAVPEKEENNAIYENVILSLKNKTPAFDLPKGRFSESWYLTTRENVGEYILRRHSRMTLTINYYSHLFTDNLLRNSSSFIYGRNPEKYSVPIYALINICHKKRENIEEKENDTINNPPLHFHVTYWMFYPFSQGKSLCTFDMGRFGAWPIPKVNNQCLGNIKEFGNHVGDWEHMSLYFEVSFMTSLSTIL